jgi:hypothetical protein
MFVENTKRFPNDLQNNPDLKQQIKGDVFSGGEWYA